MNPMPGGWWTPQRFGIWISTQSAASLKYHCLQQYVFLKILPVLRMLPNMSNVPTQVLQLVERFDRNIDALVYELYGLTDEEIKIVEGTI